MKCTKRHYMPRLVAVCAALVLIMAMACVAYAADVGGIRSNILAWFHGEQISVVMDVQDAEYSISVQGPDGASYELYGYGEVCRHNDNGLEFVRFMTEDEVMKYATKALEQQGGIWKVTPKDADGTESNGYRDSSMLDMFDSDDDEGMNLCYAFPDDDGLTWYNVLLSDHKGDTQG